MAKATPIKPEDVQKIKGVDIPSGVIKIFNELIVKNWNGCQATFNQNDVLALVELKTNFDRAQMFDNHWLDVEPLFRQAGWKVEFDKPGYNETYVGFWKFSK